MHGAGQARPSGRRSQLPAPLANDRGPADPDPEPTLGASLEALQLGAQRDRPQAKVTRPPSARRRPVRAGRIQGQDGVHRSRPRGLVERQPDRRRRGVDEEPALAASGGSGGMRARLPWADYRSPAFRSRRPGLEPSGVGVTIRLGSLAWVAAAVDDLPAVTVGEGPEDRPDRPVRAAAG